MGNMSPQRKRDPSIRKRRAIENENLYWEGELPIGTYLRSMSKTYLYSYRNSPVITSRALVRRGFDQCFARHTYAVGVLICSVISDLRCFLRRFHVRQGTGRHTSSLCRILVHTEFLACRLKLMSTPFLISEDCVPLRARPGPGGSGRTACPDSTCG
ncbi:hypothetical protein B0T13DRAFT_245015 [Neurospora crassa]|nr:hypothetical protein B0T13DRAFT_245015 [Neurospora crassa]